MSWFEALWQALGAVAGAGPGSATTALVAGVVLITLAVAALLVGPSTPGDDPGGTRRLLRDRTARMGVPRHRDPDAAGRIRPRGPTGAIPVA